MIYLDHAATSWPKPPSVVRAVAECMEEAGGNPGRGAHPLAMRAAEALFACREAAASLLGAPGPEQMKKCIAENEAYLAGGIRK